MSLRSLQMLLQNFIENTDVLLNQNFPYPFSLCFLFLTLFSQNSFSLSLPLNVKWFVISSFSSPYLSHLGPSYLLHGVFDVVIKCLNGFSYNGLFQKKNQDSIEWNTSFFFWIAKGQILQKNLHITNGYDKIISR